MKRDKSGFWVCESMQEFIDAPSPKKISFEDALYFLTNGVDRIQHFKPTRRKSVKPPIEKTAKAIKRTTGKDAKERQANDNTEKGPFNGLPLAKPVAGIMEDLKKKKRKLPNVVETEERRTIAVKYNFTAAEIGKIAQDLAQRQIELVEIEDEKKSVMASFTDRIKAKKIDIGKFSRQVRDGWENRDHNTTLVLDFKKKEKRYRDVESKKIVKAEPFSPGDDQRRFL